MFITNFVYTQHLDHTITTIPRKNFEIRKENKTIELNYNSMSQESKSSSVVGNLVGALSVSNTGGATYVLPIKIPQGINGFQPEINLTYSSQQGNGMVGWGWNISGGSVITRVAATKYHDNRLGSIKFQKLTNGDRFALDGQRLILNSGTYGHASSTYRTENYSNSKITANGFSPFGSGFGPKSFTIHHPDGSTSYYGLTNNSRTKMSYAISKFVNPSGLEIHYFYTNVGQNLYLSQITYGSKSSNNPYKIRFTYGTRELPSESFIHGERFITTRILKNIRTTISGTTFSRYKFNHDTNQMGYQRLTSVVEGNTNNSQQKAPLTFEYFDINDERPSYESTTNIGFNNINQRNSKTVTGDFDGDGKSDFLIFPTIGSNQYRKYWVVTDIRNNQTNYKDFEGNPNGRFDDIFTTSFKNQQNKLMDKQAWVVVKKGLTSYNFKAIYKSGGSSVFSQAFEKNIELPTVSVRIGCVQWCDTGREDRIFPKRFVYGDFNGDGITDVLAFDTSIIEYECRENYYDYDCIEYEAYYPKASNSSYFINLDTELDDSESYNYSGEIPGVDKETKIEVVDYNGDGKSDILIFKNGSVKVYELNRSNQLTLIRTFNNSKISLDRQILFGDFNGDGKSDFLIPNGINQDNWNFFFSRGDGNFALKNSSIGTPYRKSDFNPSDPFANTINEYNYLSYDFNRDGKTDIVMFRNRSQKNPTVSYQFFTFLKNIKCTTFSNKVIFEKKQSVQEYTSGFRRFAVPLFTNHSSALKNSTLSIMSHNKIANLRTPVDNNEEMLLRQTSDSYGNRHAIHYLPLQKNLQRQEFLPNIYTASSEEIYPYIDIHTAPSLKLVSKIEKFHGTNYLKKSYAYYGAVSHAEGLGFLGFKKTYHTNWHSSRPDNSTLSSYNPQLKGALTKSFTFDGVIGNFLTSSDPGTYTSKTINKYESELSTRKLFKLRTIQSASENTLTGTTEIKTFDYDNYENPKKITSKIKENDNVVGTSTQLINYDNSLSNSNYFVGRVKDKTNSVSSYGKTLTSSEEYLYNSNHTISQRKIAGHNTGFKTETFNYDSYGNVIDKVLEINGNYRVALYDYDPTGRFLLKKTNDEGLETNYEYYTNKNLIKSTTDYLGRKTDFFYDSWNRITKEKNYLGNSTITAYSKNNNEIKIALHSDDGSASYEKYDLQSNKTQEAFKNINGQWNKTDIVYDKYDRVIKRSEPYLSSPSLWSEIKYDNYGRKIREKKLTGKVINIRYNLLSTTTDDGFQTKTTTYDALGNMVSLTDEGGTVIYSYNPNGKLLATDYDGIITTISYDGWGRKTKLEDPSAGTYVYSYNNFDEITAEETPKGKTTYVYDESGKLLKKHIKGDSTKMTTTYSYNSITKQLETENTTSNGKNYNYNYTYDDYGRVASILEQHPFATFEVINNYDSYGRVSHTRYKANDKHLYNFSNKRVSNVYKNGQHWKILDETGNTLWELNNVDKWSTATNQSYANGISKIVNNSSFGMTSSISFNNSYGQSQERGLLNLNYEFDERKMVLNSRTTAYDTKTHSEKFSYDNLSRLTRIFSDFGFKFQRYDNKGRITTNSLLGKYEYGIKNFKSTYKLRRISLNKNGSRHYSRTSHQTVSYNAFKSPVQIAVPGKERINYEYNGDEQRSVSYYGNDKNDVADRSHQKFYSAIAPIEISWDIENDEVKIHTYIGGDQYSSSIVYEKTSTEEQMLFLHRDYLGSILAITDDGGDVIERRHFGAWGSLEKLIKNGNEVDLYDSRTDKTLLLDRGYTGHEHLYGVSLIHMNGRLYDPMLRRFLAPDNYIQDPYNTQNFNRYGYVYNNPLMYSDPSGELFFIAVAAGALIGGITAAMQGGGFGDILAGALIGGIAGGIGAGVGNLASGVGGFFGSGALSVSGFGAGATVGAMSGFAGGFVGAAGNAWVNGSNFGEGLLAGLTGGASGAVAGGLLGGITGGIRATKNGRYFWSGKHKPIKSVNFLKSNGMVAINNNVTLETTNINEIKLSSFTESINQKLKNSYSIVSETARELNPNNYVLKNEKLRKAVKNLYDGLFDDLGHENFDFQVTGGDRFIKDGAAYSSSNNKLIPNSGINGAHMTEKGARAVDLRINLSTSRVEPIAKGVNLFYQKGYYPVNYSDRHHHLQLLNYKSNWY